MQSTLSHSTLKQVVVIPKESLTGTSMSQAFFIYEWGSLFVWQNFPGALWGSQNFFGFQIFYGKGGKIFSVAQRRIEQKKIDDRPSQTESPTTHKKDSTLIYEDDRGQFYSHCRTERRFHLAIASHSFFWDDNYKGLS